MDKLEVREGVQPDPHNFASELRTLVAKAAKAYCDVAKNNDLGSVMELEQYRAQLTRVVVGARQFLVPLYGRKDGLVGDKDNYSDEVIIDVIVSAACRGLVPQGNQINIIAGQLYIAQNGYRRLLSMIGVTDLRVVLSPGEVKNGYQVAECDASWVYKGNPDSHKRKYWVRVNAGAGWDQSEGKAKRKLFKDIFEVCTDQSDPDNDPDVRESAIEVEGEVVDETPDTAEDALETAKDLAKQILALMGESEVHPEAYLKYLFDEDTIKEPVGSVFDLVVLDPDLAGILVRTWPKRVERFREKSKVEASA